MSYDDRKNFNYNVKKTVEDEVRPDSIYLDEGDTVYINVDQNTGSSASTLDTANSSLHISKVN